MNISTKIWTTIFHSNVNLHIEEVGIFTLLNDFAINNLACIILSRKLPIV